MKNRQLYKISGTLFILFLLLAAIVTSSPGSGRENRQFNGHFQRCG